MINRPAEHNVIDGWSWRSLTCGRAPLSDSIDGGEATLDSPHENRSRFLLINSGAATTPTNSLK